MESKRCLDMLKALFRNSFLLLLVVSAFLFFGCSKQTSKLSRSEKNRRNAEIKMQNLTQKYSKELVILNSSAKEKTKIKKIGKIVGAKRYRVSILERLFDTALTGNNIPFTRYKQLLNRDIKAVNRAIKSLKICTEAFELRSELRSLLNKLKDMHFLVKKHKEFRMETRYIHSYCEQRRQNRK